MTKTKSQITIHDCETGEVITRDATVAEIAQIEIDAAALVAQKTELAAKEAQRQAILDRLGLTSDEAKLILG
jgi:3-deoxy-D-manno-octulosonic-acid transferase